MIRPLVAILAIFVIGAIAYAAPPENANPAYSAWFRSLQDDKGTSCCAESDGRAVEYRIVGDHYEALVGKQFPDGPDPPVWVAIPPDKVLTRPDNPTGRAILFWRPWGILCFVLPPQV